jgi:hypothetical protein
MKVLPSSPHFTTPHVNYTLVLRPRSSEPLCKMALRTKLLSAGLQVRPDCGRHELLGDGFAVFEIVDDSEISSGCSVVVRIPCRRDLFDVTLEFVNLERIARVLDADLIDGNEAAAHRGKESLISLFALHASYERASEGTLAV